MKIVKIFSNKNFKNIEFHNQFNVVIANIFDRSSKKKNTHGLGKTSLIHVINFLLLGGFDEKVFGNKLFEGQTFYGEIELNSGKYLIIKRSINSPSKVSFKLNAHKMISFIAPEAWDVEDSPFDKAKEALNKHLNFDVLSNSLYRKAITYFLRTQQDYLDVFKLGKYKGKDIEWKPFVFELLGYDGELINRKLDLESEAAELRKKIEILKAEANINIDEKDKLNGLLDIKKQEVENARATIDKFNFYEHDRSINTEVIEKIDFQIQALNSDRYRIEYEISKIEESLSQTNKELDIEQLKSLFSEVKLYFPNELKKQFTELLQFNKLVSNERQKYLSENLQDLKAVLLNTNHQINELEKDKSDKLSFLTEKDTYVKFKGYQKELSLVEADISRLEDKINAIDRSLEIEDQIKVIKDQLDFSISAIKKAVALRKHAELNKIFNSIIAEILGANAVISIKPNKNNNIDFEANYENPNDFVATAEDKGTTYKKVLCMAFDLSLLIYYAKNSFFKFVYHDGILEGMDDRIKIRLLNKVKVVCREYNIQYILSLIDSDIPVQSDGTKYPITSNEICLELHDKDDSGKLFLKSF